MLIRRSIITQIDFWIDREEIIFLAGARQTGKTTLLKYYRDEIAKKELSVRYYNFENPSDVLLASDYDVFLKKALSKHGKTYIFIDEVQLHPHPSNFLKYLFDEYRNQIKLMVTGSVNFELKSRMQDSLVGRKITFEIMPFNFSEFLLAKEYETKIYPVDDVDQMDQLLEEYMIYGGLPSIVLARDSETKRRLLSEYVRTYIGKDARSLILDESITSFNKMLIILARETGNLKNDQNVCQYSAQSLYQVKKGLDVLQYTYICRYLYPYYENPIARIRKTQKVYFHDTGVRNAILEDFRPMPDRTDSGALFENVVLNEIRAKTTTEHLYYLRSSSGNEVDFVVHDEFGNRYFIEAKYRRISRSPKYLKGLAYLRQKANPTCTYVVNRSLEHMTDGIEYISFSRFVRDVHISELK